MDLLTNFRRLVNLTSQSLSLLGLDAGHGKLNVLGSGGTFLDAALLLELSHGNGRCDGGFVEFVVQLFLLVDLVLGVDDLLLNGFSLDDGLNSLVKVAVRC